MIVCHHEQVLELVGPALSMGPVWGCVARAACVATALGVWGAAVASWGLVAGLIVKEEKVSK